MLFMVIEHFKDGDAKPVYRRFRDRGRLMPEGLRYVDSWVDREFRRCYQLVDCDDPALLDAWTAAWADLVDFEVPPVVPSKEAYAALKPEL
jgi:succinylarginine dihydrolase